MNHDERSLVSISDHELGRRWGAVRTAMQARGLDALVVQGSNDWLGGYVRWFTDHPATNGYPRSVIFHKDGTMSVVEMGGLGGSRIPDPGESAYRGVAETLTTPAFLSISHTNAADGQLALDVLRRHGCRAVGAVCPGGWAHGFGQVLQNGLPEGALVDATDWIDAIKAVKSDEEVALIRRSAALHDQVFAKVQQAIRPGLRDIDVTALAQHEALILGSEQGVFLGASNPMGRAAPFMPRHKQGRTLQPGDHFPLLIEVNGPGGFYTELARTFVLGRASNELKDGFAAMLDAQDHTLSLLRPGVPAREVAAAHDRYMQARGLPEETRLYCHGQGYDMVERPLVRADDAMTIEAGMCLAVHPGSQTERMFAVICDNYMIGPDGPGECLHRTKKRLFEV